MTSQTYDRVIQICVFVAVLAAVSFDRARSPVLPAVALILAASTAICVHLYVLAHLDTEERSSGLANLGRACDADRGAVPELEHNLSNVGTTEPQPHRQSSSASARG